MPSVRTMWMRIAVVSAALVGLALLGNSLGQDVPDPDKPAPAVAPRTPAPEVPAPAGPKPGTESIFGLLLKGGWVMVPLALCSVLAVASAIDRFLGLRR